MKTLFYTILFIGTILSIDAQSNFDWEALAPHNFSQLSLLHLYANGDILARRAAPESLVISKDDGATWQEFYLGEVDNVYASFYSNRWHFKEDNLGNIYYDNGVKIIQVKDGSLVDIYVGASAIHDFNFLANGNVVVAESERLALIDINGTIINSVDWTIVNAELMIGSDGINYSASLNGNIDRIRTFNDDLSFLSEEIVIPDIRNSIYLSNGRLFSDYNYSDDGGLSWTGIQSNLFFTSQASVLGAKDNNVLVYASQDVYLSKDNGSNFELIASDFRYYPIYGEFYILMNGSSIVSLENGCSNPLAQVSRNFGENWQTNESFSGNPYAHNAAIDFNSNVVLRSCDPSYFTQENESDNWVFHTNDDDRGLFEIYSLPDNSFLKSSKNGFFKSYDEGKTWVKKHDLFCEYTRIKESIIVAYGYFTTVDEQVIVSYDYGETWESISIVDLPAIFNLRELEVLNEGKIIYWDPISFCGNCFTICDLDFDNCHNVENEDWNEKFVSVVSGFNTSNIYALKNFIGSGDYKIYYTADEGVTHEIRPIDLDVPVLFTEVVFRVDHNENLFFGFKNKLYMSVDGGLSWIDISENFPSELQTVNNVSVGYDDYVYVANEGAGLLKSKFKVGSNQRLAVKVFNDKNEDCIFQTGEDGIGRVKLIVGENLIKPTNSEGNAFFLINEEDHNLSISFNEELYESCEESYEITIDENEQVKELYIPLKVIKECIALESNLSAPLLRRCFENYLTAEICNYGTIPSGREKTLLELDPFFDLLSTSIPLVSQDGQILEFETEELQPGDCMRIRVGFELNCDAELGQLHCSSLNTEYENDCNENDISYRLGEFCMENIGSYDPNDKSIIVNSVQGQTNAEEDDEIEYLIRFQNTGTDTAFTVRIEDDLSSKFDYNSVKPLVASHDYDWTLEGGKLEVTFDNILLVDSTTNEPASHGFVKFKIELKDGIEIGESFSNEAAIYFDFNDPIITNQVSTTFGPPDAVANTKPSFISLYPNPTNEYLQVPLDLAFDKIEIYSINGHKFDVDFDLQRHKLDVSSLPGGCYLIRIEEEGAFRIGKFVKM